MATATMRTCPTHNVHSTLDRCWIAGCPTEPIACWKTGCDGRPVWSPTHPFHNEAMRHEPPTPADRWQSLAA